SVSVFLWYDMRWTSPTLRTKIFISLCAIYLPLTTLSFHNWPTEPRSFMDFDELMHTTAIYRERNSGYHNWHPERIKLCSVSLMKFNPMTRAQSYRFRQEIRNLSIACSLNIWWRLKAH